MCLAIDQQQLSYYRLHPARVSEATTVWTSNASSVNGSSHAINNNNFSNISLTGASNFGGISDTDGASAVSGPVKSINGNTFNNINTGAGTVLPMSVNSQRREHVGEQQHDQQYHHHKFHHLYDVWTSNQATLTASETLIRSDHFRRHDGDLEFPRARQTAVYSKNKIYDLSGTGSGINSQRGIAIVNTTASSNVTLSNNPDQKS